MENRTPNGPNPSQAIDFDGGNQCPKISLYEQSREERIKKNLQRMQELGLTDLSLKLQVTSAATRRRGRKNSSLSPAPLPDRASIRRSSRLKNTTPVSYSEVVIPEKNEGLKLEVGLKPEVYSEEHAKLLGSTERSWTFFVDGYGKDGRRIYDPVRGKTCHQCRQKTLGYRTNCRKCNMVQGQFCGDCLYMRYGEHVLEAIENPDWICPVCRGICNCSLCRQSKGWAPTGALYRKISKMGYKSVAHYLIQTRTKASEVKNPDGADLVLGKRSLFDINCTGELEPNWEDCANKNGFEKEEKIKTEATSFPSLPASVKKSLLFADSATNCAKPTDNHVESKWCDGNVNKSDLQLIIKDSSLQVQLGCCLKPVQNQSITFELSTGVISGTVNDADEKVDMEVTDVKTTADEGLTATPSGDENGKDGYDRSSASSRKRPKRGVGTAVEISLNSIKGRLRRRPLQINQDCVAR